MENQGKRTKIKSNMKKEVSEEFQNISIVNGVNTLGRSNTSFREGYELYRTKPRINKL